MPFLHFETSEGYDRMSEVISDTKGEKEKEVLNETMEGEKEMEGEHKGKAHVNEEENDTKKGSQKGQEEQSTKLAENGQAVGKETKGPLNEEGESSFEDEGKGSKGGAGREGTDDLIFRAGQKDEKKRKATQSTTDTQDELATDPAEATRFDEKIEEAELERPQSEQPENISERKERTNDEREPSLQVSGIKPEEIIVKPRVGQGHADTDHPSSESVLSPINCIHI